MNQIMTSQVAADKIIEYLKNEIDNGNDPNESLSLIDTSMITEIDARRIEKEIERYVEYGY